ncbi:SAM-dependent methyltransferase [Nocardia nepalensis]|uniref:SAM-dependent methyltransferase n=1 Tax=Nocardia nepalensis TaxID=3375448 RepID=UPI003B66FC10
MSGLVSPRVVGRMMLVWKDMKAHHSIFADTLTALNLSADDRLLEIGCGGGTFAALALASDCRLTAVDHSADMMALTEAANADALREGRLQVFEADAEGIAAARPAFQLRHNNEHTLLCPRCEGTR